MCRNAYANTAGVEGTKIRHESNERGRAVVCPAS
jgi:hypothetical protein